MRASTFLTLVVALVLLASPVFGDIYLHSLRGSNNRNRGNGVNVENANRLFDSQNNNKGGYCWGPPLTLYEGSMLQIEWTSQHGCGVGHPNVDCDIILQYMCAPGVRDGTSSNTITEATKDDPAFGMHEDYENYRKCRARQRNVGLFAADQNLPRTASAMRSRQQNQENDPHGFECEEERVFYPYWHPSPWRDIAILTSNTDRCSYFKQNSQNVLSKNECSDPAHNNEAQCTANGATWLTVPPHNIPAPECVANGFARDNHNGNTKTGFTNTYNWELPRLSEVGTLNSDGTTANCAFRIRYNISTGDTRGFRHVDSNGREDMLDSGSNDNLSPVRNNPYVGYGSDGAGKRELRLALNTQQYGRTFQDRSHMFKLSKRPMHVGDSARIINLNVRGKRGNIVQAYPAVEYDFTPTYLEINIGDFVHFQWTGCDTNPNYAGEGTEGTDRSNIVALADSRNNYPMPLEEVTMIPQDIAFDLAHLKQYDGVTCTSLTQTNCCKPRRFPGADPNSQPNNIDNQDPQNCMKLNDPKRAYFDGGVVAMNTAGTFNYYSTRNNNFSNRSQKGQIIVGTVLPIWGIVVAVGGGAAFTGAGVLSAGVYYARTHPGTSLANVFSSVRI